MPARSRLLAVVLATGLANAALAEDGELHPIQDGYTVSGPLGGEDGEPAQDISGIACGPMREGKPRHCLVVNDEGASALAVTIEGRTIAPGKRVTLIDENLAKDTRGVPPAGNRCPDRKEKKKNRFKEFDGEGVAYAEPYFYVVGSHGCGRKKGKFKSSSLRLARIKADGHGRIEDGRIETTFRLGEAFAKAEPIQTFNLTGLMEENGLNVEGVAVVDGILYAGLRAPSRQGIAYLVGVSAEALFATGNSALAETPNVVPLEVGQGAGIRDLAPLGRSRLLVLIGPAQEQAEVKSSLLIVDLSDEGGKPPRLGKLADLPNKERSGKAEAITVFEPNRVLVLYDSLPNGAPHAYDVPLGP